MQKLLVCLAILCLFSAPALAADKAFDVRGVPLGAHADAVLKAEDAHAAGYKVDNQSAYFTLNDNEEVFGLKAQSVRYYFTPEQLVRSIYLDYGKYESGDRTALQDFQQLAKNLTVLYGQPVFSINLKSSEHAEFTTDEAYTEMTLQFPEMVQYRAMWVYNDTFLDAALLVSGKTKQYNITILCGNNEE